MKEEHVTVELLFWRDINLNINNFGKTAIIAVFFFDRNFNYKTILGSYGNEKYVD